MASEIVLPGQEIPAHLLPSTKKGTLTLGPGLRHTPPSTISAFSAGALSSDSRKGALWLESLPGRYLPASGDLVVAQIHHSATDLYYCSLTPHTSNAMLGHLSFEGASRKTRPQLKAGDLVYARVCRSVKGEDVEVECVNSSTGKADGLGPLKGGMTFEISSAFARRLMMPSGKGAVKILDGLGEKLRFEVAVGRNGVVWIDSTSVKSTIAIGSLLMKTDELKWDAERQAKEIKASLRKLELGD